ncbi:hypothetical protein MMAR_1942 [Mycobacterium marinum M]|uniref:Uncharacterized protein n=1 Tax=Mycobacterium marinum (strain ATCC BAA-535 / M) TaxID=216594 RepID=B2HKX0_MYCMM|nr:HEPN domain-containing protein [Mycobacterium marinum]ACC40391.1 hypothetical protein MMAR_1942 [Mycobacterium marinum M]
MTEQESYKSGGSLDLDKIRRLLDPILAQQERAARFAETDARRGHFFALAGVPTPNAPALIAASGLFEVHAVDHPPGLVNLTGALRPESRLEYAKLGGAITGTTHELWLSEKVSDRKFALSLANRIIYLLRVGSGWSARAVGYADTSWSAVAAQRGSVMAHVLGEEWHQRARFGSAVLSQADVNWVDTHVLEALARMRETRFSMAFDAAGEVHLISDLRMAVSRAWAGVEALLGINQELTFRIALYLAVLLRSDPEDRVKLRAEVKTLYGLRSKAVHGVEMTDAVLLDTARRSWTLLRETLIAILELDEPTPDAARLDQVLLGHQLARKSAQPTAGTD